MHSRRAGSWQRKIEPFHWGLFSPKAINFLDNSNAFINILHGSVRSSKTITANLRWIQFITKSPHNKFLLTGKTRDTIERNVVDDIISMIHGKIHYKYNKNDGYLDIGNKRNYIVGFNDEGATDRIRGMTVGGWYSDETATAPESSIKMAMNRCSLPEAKMFWTMNPNSPYHYIAREYLNNKELKDKGVVKVWHFTLEDNLNLTKEYVEQLKLLYSKSALQYKRYILGMWVIAEGAIYDQFVESENTFTKAPKMDTLNICCDYGVSTVTTFGVMGIKKSLTEGNSYYLLEETYYDAEEMGVAQTDSQRLEDILRLQKKHKLNQNNTLFLPHDAASLKAECEQSKKLKMKVRTYTPNTFEDIQTIQQLIADRKFKIHTSCKNSITQAQTYSWDTKAKKRGEDRPLKQDDHCPDMWRGGILGPRTSNIPSLEIIDL